MLSIDGNFGLCRKNMAGQSYRQPLSRDMYFLDQESVDKFVESYKYSSTNKDVSLHVLVSLYEKLSVARVS